MSLPWQSARIWEGDTVAVCGCGPGLDPERAYGCGADHIVAVNQAVRALPDAEMLVALDAPWRTEYHDFAGIKVCGLPDPEVDGFHLGHAPEIVTLPGGGRCQLRNSGITALRLAIECGAARLVLVGFSPERAGEHFPGYEAGRASAKAHWHLIEFALAGRIFAARQAGIEVIHA